METILCDICQAPMKFFERIKSNKSYRIRRFKCTICDYQRTIFCEDRRDKVIEPKKAIKEINKIYKQEEINRYGK